MFSFIELTCILAFLNSVLRPFKLTTKGTTSKLSVSKFTVLPFTDGVLRNISDHLYILYKLYISLLTFTMFSLPEASGGSISLQPVSSCLQAQEVTLAASAL